MNNPLFFIGHGSPMTVLNPEVGYLKALKQIPNKNLQALVVLSAHWTTGDDIYVSGQEENPLIYDFSGFPKKLYDVEFKSQGSLEIANELASSLGASVKERGLDHGVWTVLKPIEEGLSCPVIQISIPHNWSFQKLFDLGKKLQSFRDRMVFVGSGDFVHNLPQMNRNKDAEPIIWASEFETRLLKFIHEKTYPDLVDLEHDLSLKQSHPTLEHFQPLLIVLGAITGEDHSQVLYQKIEHGSVSMTCVCWAPSQVEKEAKVAEAITEKQEVEMVL